MRMRRLSKAPGRGGIATAAKIAATMALVMLMMLPQASLAQDGPPPDDDEDGGGGPGLSDETFDSSSTTTSSYVECAQNGTDAHYDEFLSGTGLTTVRIAGSYTGCPNHINWPINPTSAWVIPTNASIPAYPMLMANGGTTDLSEAAGIIAIMRNGVAMFGPWAVFKVVEYEDTAFFLEADTLDPCGGHATPSGSYHYHGTAGCLQEQAGAVVGEHSPLLGWSYDGFPFYGQLGPGGVEMKMCGVDGADPTHCLDECSGYEAYIDEDEFAYRYYTSCGFDESFFPFTANCYRGCCPTGVTCSDRIEACDEDAEIGYTEDHVPVVSTPLDEQYDAQFIDGDDVDLLGTEVTVNCTLYLGAGSVLDATADADGANATTPAPSPVSSGDTTAAPVATTPGDTEAPSPIADDGAVGIPVTPSPSSGGDINDADGASDASGASGVTSGATGIAVVAMTAFAAATMMMMLL